MSATWGRITKETLTAIATAIRAKTGKAGLIAPVDMADEIDGIEIGGDVDGILDGSVSGALQTGAITIAMRRLSETAITSLSGPAGLGSYACYHCASLKTLTLQDGAAIYEDALAGCTALEAVHGAPSYIGTWAFYDCGALQSVDLSRCTRVASAAFEKSGLQTVDAPLLELRNSTKSFYGAASLQSVHLAACAGIGESCLDGLKNLTTFDGPSCHSIMKYGMRGCTGLTELILPSGWTLYTGALTGCTGLTVVDLGNRTTTAGTIQGAALSNCTALKHLVVRCSSMTKLENTSALTKTPIAGGTGYIYVPRDLVDTYKSATNWSTYANQFRALEDYTSDGTASGTFVPPTE